MAAGRQAQRNAAIRWHRSVLTRASGFRLARRLVPQVDGANAESFRGLCGAERGERCCFLLSPVAAPLVCGDSAPAAGWGAGGGAVGAVAAQGSLFTLFLTSPLAAVCALLDVRAPPLEAVLAAEAVLAEACAAWGDALVAARSTARNGADFEPWVRVIGDPFLRQLVLRFVLARGMLKLHRRHGVCAECQPSCCPPLPAALMPAAPPVLDAVHRIASALGRRSQVMPPLEGAEGAAH